MIVDVLVNYTASLVPPGKRKAESVKLRDAMAVSIREAGPDEAPVVAWWSPEGTRDQVALRHLDGRLYGPVTLSESDVKAGKAIAKGAKDPTACRKASRPEAPGIAGLVTAEILAGLMAEGKGYVSGLHLRRMDFDASVPTLDEVPHRKVETTNRAAVEASLQGHAAELLSVNGTVYRMVPEPVLRVERDFRGVSLGSGYSEGGHKSLALAYRLDRWDDALATWRLEMQEVGLWEKRFERGRDLPWNCSLTHRPEVLRPDLLGLDDRALAARDVARRIVHGLSQPNRGGYVTHHGQPYVLSFDRVVAVAYARTRDALRNDAGVDALLSHLSGFAEAADGVGLLTEQHKEVMGLLARMEREADHGALAGLEAPACA